MERLNTPATDRLPVLDVLRGVALIGVLLVNLPHIALPTAAVANPGLAPWNADAVSIAAWLGVHLLFDFKAITLLSMLFGVTILLVGSKERDATGTGLRRRLGWLAVIGLLHGAVIWNGDILLSYALCGFVAATARHGSARRLAVLSAMAFAVFMALLSLVTWSVSQQPATALAETKRLLWTPDATAMAQGWQTSGSWIVVQRANLAEWATRQIELLVVLGPRTLAAMWLGMALYKYGVFSLPMQSHVAKRLLIGGALAMATLGAHALWIAGQGFPFVPTHLVHGLLNAAVSPLIALNYVVLASVLVAEGRLGWITGLLSSLGRLSLTNYIAQSLLFTTMFWSGRGLGWFATWDRGELFALGLACAFLMALASRAWWNRFGPGPLEKLWRALSSPSRSMRSAVVFPDAAAVETPAIETIGLSRSFNGQTAIENVSLLVPRGSIYGFLGANGAGKTTTLRAVCGLLRADCGTIKILGTDRSLDRNAAARKLGVLLDAQSCYGHLTGRENLELTRRILSAPRSDVHRVLALFNLATAADRRVEYYSLGMRQRLGLARAMLGSPKILVLDEPLNGLDPEGIREMRDCLKRLSRDQGITILLSSHLLSEIEETATHVGVMANGHLVAQGTLASIMAGFSDRIRLRVTNPDEAAAALAELGYPALREGGVFTITIANEDAMVSRLTSMLVLRGVGLVESTRVQPRLDEVYRQLAGDSPTVTPC